MILSKKEKELKRILEEYTPAQIIPERKSAALNEVVKEAEKRRIRTGISFWIRLKTQAVYIPKALWIIEFIILILGMWGTIHSPAASGLTILSVASPALGVIVFPALVRSFSSGMWELEQSTRYSLKEICCVRLFIFGITDACILAVLFAAVERKGAALGNYLLWVVVPFAFSCSLYMYLIRKIGNSTVNYVLVCAGTFLCGVCLYLHRYYGRMEYFLSGSAGTVITVAALVTTVAVLGTQVCAYVKFVSQKGKGWDEIWNYN